MSEFEWQEAGNTEAQQKAGAAYLFDQTSTGTARTGVLKGLTVAQTATASGSVLVAAGAGVVQASVLVGASLLVNDTQKTLDIFTANPMGAVPRNDIVVFDKAASGIRAITGTPNAVPTDPTIPTDTIPLARLRHAASATTIPTAKIDSLIVSTSVAGTRLPAVTTKTASDYSTSGGTEITMVTAPSVTADGVRRFKLSLSFFGAQTTVYPTTAEIRLYRGATLVRSFRVVPEVVGSSSAGGTLTASEVPPAGTTTYTAKVARVAGSGVVLVAGDIELLVEHVA